ncbi:MAG: noncanonical pyrimidine nucleotidase, YjjG family [Bacteroidetes bacterium]|jgi:putative hydrolase of the HAD superfamily|nr:noncanonical pyrimidine nucleotidase, YjjG family [Bacteroidota bacterium]
MKRYKHIFFDLDRTLWDFESNAREAFFDIFEEFSLHDQIPDIYAFIEKYHLHNDRLWSSFRNGLIKKEFLRTERFHKTLKDFGINNTLLASEIGGRYLDITPNKTNLVPYAAESLNYLSLKNYKLHVITNGFKTVQVQKLKSCNLLQYFTGIITSDDVEKQKPHSDIFEFALSSTNAVKKSSIMIGDDWEVDILGAQRFGLDQVYFNPEKNALMDGFSPTFEIYSLQELKRIFN